MATRDRSDSSVEVFRLLDLPRELRDVIYSYLFRSDYVGRLCSHGLHTCGRQWMVRWRPSSLFRANRQIYDESLPVFLACGRFLIELKDEYSAFPGQPICFPRDENLDYLKDDRILRSIQNVRINIMVDVAFGGSCRLGHILKALDAATSLKSVLIGWYNRDALNSLQYPVRPPLTSLVPELLDLRKIDDVRVEMPPDFKSMPEDSVINFKPVQITLEQFLTTEAASIEAAKFLRS